MQMQVAGATLRVPGRIASEVLLMGRMLALPQCRPLRRSAGDVLVAGAVVVPVGVAVEAVIALEGAEIAAAMRAADAATDFQLQPKTVGKPREDYEVEKTAGTEPLDSRQVNAEGQHSPQEALAWSRAKSKRWGKV